MLKTASVALFVLLLTLGSVLVFRNYKPPREASHASESGRPPSLDPDDKEVITNLTQFTNLTRFPKSFRQRARALIASYNASEADLQVANREVKAAKIEYDQAVSEVELLEQAVHDSESEMDMAIKQRDAQYASWDAKRGLAMQTAGYLGAIGAQPMPVGDPPLEADRAVSDAERRLRSAKDRFNIQRSQSLRRIEQARLQAKNSQDKIARAVAAQERAKAELFENLLPPELPK
jgi:hypothetical protein